MAKGDSAKLLTVWNWLPAFRAVAETQHLPTASQRFHVSVSALSRSVGLLEDTLGRALFERAGRRIVLNEAGRLLLAAVQEALVRIGNTIDRISEPTGPRAFQIATVGALGHTLVLPALRELQKRRIDLVPHVHEFGAETAVSLLRTRELDVAFFVEAGLAPDLCIEQLGELPCHVFCGADHPLFGAAVSAAEVGRHAFCAAAAGENWDAWPAAEPREIAVYVRQAETALLLCAKDRLLTVLPDVLAGPHVRSGALQAVDAVSLPPLPVFAAWRANDADAEALVAAVREQIAAEEGGDALPLPAAGEAGWLSLPDALLLRGEYGAARRAYRAAIRKRRRTRRFQPSDDAEIQLRLARVELHAGRYADARRRCVSASARARGVAELQAASFAVLALVHCYAGDLDRASACMTSGRALLDGLPSSRELSRLSAEALLLRGAGNVLVARGQLSDAAATFRRGVEVCAQLGDRWEHSIALYNLAETLLGEGGGTEALRHLERAQAEKRAIGDRWGLGYVHYARARAELLRKRPQMALTEAGAGLELALGIRDPKLLALLNLTLARAHQAGGDLAGAERALRFALKAARRCSSRNEMIEAHLALAAAHLAQGRPLAAQKAANRARTLASRTGARKAAQAATTLLDRARKP